MVAVISLLDDLDQAAGKETPGATTHRLYFDGRAVEIDLSEQHADELTKTLAPYFEHGRTQRGTDRANTRGHGITSQKMSRAEGVAMRKWATERGLKNLFTTPQGGYYPKKELRELWQSHKHAEGLSFDG